MYITVKEFAAKHNGVRYCFSLNFRLLITPFHYHPSPNLSFQVLELDNPW